MKLGKAIKLLRMVDNLDQKDMAEILDISASTLSRIEAGKGCDSRSLMKVLAWLTAEDDPDKRAEAAE